MKKLIIGLLALSASVAVHAADPAVVAKYNKSCVVCHAAGAAGAPKTGVAADWQPRLEKGIDALVHSVEKGMGAMPPKGMCFDCSADDFKALIEHMTAAK